LQRLDGSTQIPVQVGGKPHVVVDDLLLLGPRACFQSFAVGIVRLGIALQIEQQISLETGEGFEVAAAGKTKLQRRTEIQGLAAAAELGQDQGQPVQAGLQLLRWRIGSQNGTVAAFGLGVTAEKEMTLPDEKNSLIGIRRIGKLDDNPAECGQRPGIIGAAQGNTAGTVQRLRPEISGRIPAQYPSVAFPGRRPVGEILLHHRLEQQGMIVVRLLIGIFFHLILELRMTLRVVEQLKVGAAEPVGNSVVVCRAGILAGIVLQGGNASLELPEIEIRNPAEILGIVGQGTVRILIRQLPEVPPGHDVHAILEGLPSGLEEIFGALRARGNAPKKKQEESQQRGSDTQKLSPVDYSASKGVRARRVPGEAWRNRSCHPDLPWPYPFYPGSCALSSI
jgi:hypothetical protein